MFETENGFYKREENRTNNTRVLDTTEILYCDCIIAEFEAANRLYQAGQKHYPSEHLFVEPYELEERNGEINGYTMEVLEGNTLEHHISPKRNGEIDNLNVSKVKQQLKRASEVIETEKEPHGDLEPWNIMVNQQSDITIFDPVGYPEQFVGKEGEIQRDTRKLEQIINELETSTIP